jgi:hypothetical protein
MSNLYNRIIENKEFIALHSWSLESLLYQLECKQRFDKSLLLKLTTACTFFNQVISVLSSSIADIESSLKTLS